LWALSRQFQQFVCVLDCYPDRRNHPARNSSLTALGRAAKAWQKTWRQARERGRNGRVTHSDGRMYGFLKMWKGFRSRIELNKDTLESYHKNQSGSKIKSVILFIPKSSRLDAFRRRLTYFSQDPKGNLGKYLKWLLGKQPKQPKERYKRQNLSATRRTVNSPRMRSCYSAPVRRARRLSFPNTVA